LDFRELDRVVVKGREEPVTLFEPIALSGRETPDEPKMVECYHRALELYRAGRFGDAKRVWDEMGPANGPATSMAERCQAYIADPPQGDWSGTWVLGSK